VNSSKKSNRTPKKKPIKRSKKNKSRRVSIKKKKITENDISNIQKYIETIRSKKTNDIKKELEGDGIVVSGKSNRLLKDIYLYSKLGGIRIIHE